MRRSELKRGKPLKRTRMKRKPPASRDEHEEPARQRWIASVAAHRACAHCGQRGRISGHHVVLEQDVRKEGGDPWDIRNMLPVLHYCHLNHHQGSAWQKIAQSQLLPANLEFARDLLGDRAQDYLDRHYPRLPVRRNTSALAATTAAQ